MTIITAADLAKILDWPTRRVRHFIRKMGIGRQPSGRGGWVYTTLEDVAAALPGDEGRTLARLRELFTVRCARPGGASTNLGYLGDPPRFAETRE